MVLAGLREIIDAWKNLYTEAVAQGYVRGTRYPFNECLDYARIDRERDLEIFSVKFQIILFEWLLTWRFKREQPSASPDSANVGGQVV